MNWNKYNLQIGEPVIYDGQDAVILDFIDELTARISTKTKFCCLKERDTLLNKFYRFIGWPTDADICEGLRPTVLDCSIYMLKRKV